jgi:hypothetical protein
MLKISLFTDAQPRGGNRQTEKRFCKLDQLSFFVVFELFKSFIGLDPGGGLGPPHTTHAFTTAVYWKMAQTLGVYAYMLQVCCCFSAQSTNMSI